MQPVGHRVPGGQLERRIDARPIRPQHPIDDQHRQRGGARDGTQRNEVYQNYHLTFRIRRPIGENRSEAQVPGACVWRIADSEEISNSPPQALTGVLPPLLVGFGLALSLCALARFLLSPEAKTELKGAIPSCVRKSGSTLTCPRVSVATFLNSHQLLTVSEEVN